MRVSTANIKNNPPMMQRHVVHDMRTLRTMSNVIMWQEIGRARYKDALTHTLGPAWQHAHLDSDIPISWKRDAYALVDKGIVRTHKGRALASPARYITWVVLRRTRDAQHIAIVNTHYVSGAWNAKRKPFKTWRKYQWATHYQHHAHVIASLLARGYSVIGGGDFNRLTVNPLHPRLQWITDNGNGLDHLYYVPAALGVRITVHDRWSTTRLYTDHPAKTARITLETPRRGGV